MASARAPRRRLIVSLFAGSYCWFLTVLPLTLVSGASQWTMLFAGAALLSLLLSPIVPPGRWSLLLVLDFFVGFSLLTWWWSRDTLSFSGSATFGALGWLAYTLALGVLSSPDAVGEPQERRRGDLLPRRVASRSSGLVLFLSIGAGLYLLNFAWKIERPFMAVLGQILSLSAALLLLRAGTLLAEYFQGMDTSLEEKPRLRGALLPFFGVAFFFALWVRYYSTGG